MELNDQYSKLNYKMLLGRLCNLVLKDGKNFGANNVVVILISPESELRLLKLKF